MSKKKNIKPQVISIVSQKKRKKQQPEHALVVSKEKRGEDACRGQC